jgi:HK97 gp10 family phage protein
MAVQRSRVEGLSEINQVLKQLPERVQKNTLQRSVNAGGRVILKAVKAKAPRHEGKQSPASKRYGTLFKNLRMRAMSKLRAGARGVRIFTGDAFWSRFFELGTSHQPARPFMRPAFDESAGEAVGKMRDTLAEGVEREAAKLAGEYKTAKKSLGVR